MAILKCKMCGGALTAAPDSTIAECEYCGSLQTLPRVSDERLSGLYERANDLRLGREYDKAAEVYEKIIEENPNDPDVYWSLVLCKYGIEYVEEYKGAPRKPTINRTQLTSVTDDANYRSALKNADAQQKAIYENEAKVINEIQKSILAISQKEEPFDVFICYKDSDENGRRTQDSVLAQDLYYQLIQEGFKVFFSRITLEDKLGTAYEPYIFAALNSAKVMVVLGTRPEYFNAVWVKNEWSRYLTLIKGGAKKLLIPAYRDMDPYDLPQEFSNLQAQDMSKLGFMQDLIRGIKKILAKDAPEKASASKSREDAQQNTANVDTLLQRAEIFLEDQDWSSANIYCEKVLDIKPTNGKAYFYKLLAEARVTNEEALKNYSSALDTLKAYKNAVRYADEAMSANLINYNQDIKKRLDREREEREEAIRRQKERERMIAEYRTQGQNLNTARNNAASVVSAQVQEKERLESILQNNIFALNNLKKHNRMILIPAIICIVFGIVIFSSMVNNTDIGPVFWLLQTIPAMVLAHARYKSKVKAFFLNLFTVGLFPFFSGIKGLIEALGTSGNDKLLEQQELRNSIRQVEEQINISRKSLSELNAKIEEHEARGKDILV